MGRFRNWLSDQNFHMMHLEQMRDVIKRSRELLANSPAPDTFAGRRARGPFPSREDQRDNIESSIHSDEQPPRRE